MKVTRDTKKEIDQKLIKLAKLFITVTCAIASYFLVFSVKSDMQFILYVVSLGPIVTAGWLIHENWLG